MTRIELSVANPDLLVGLVEAEGVAVIDSPPALRALIDELVARRRAEDFPPPERKAAIRRLLRAGGFEASGRNKPASEYLAARAREGAFPFHSNVVDIGNYISLLSALPVSVLDTDLALGGADALSIRLGAEGESYIFNPSGQEIRVQGLVCVARAGGPALGSPVKDSMASKVRPATTRVVAALYAARSATPEGELRELLEEFERLLRLHAGAASTSARVLA
jgi:DNA/RNA-binding domain of Phe-tRNA-synthetase-like protein